jgi:GGDEF domain-containing protein
MVDFGADERSLAEGWSAAVGAAAAAGRPGDTWSRWPAREQDASAPPLTDWRGFHIELRGAALAATRTGAPLSLLMLEPGGLCRSVRQGNTDLAVERIGALADLIRSAVGGRGALARYAEERLAVIMRETDLCGAIAGAERIGQSLTAPGNGTGAVPGCSVPAIGVAQYHDDESLGDLIQRAAEALGRAKAEHSLVAVADRRLRPRPARPLCLAGADPCRCGWCSG